MGGNGLSRPGGNLGLRESNVFLIRGHVYIVWGHLPGFQSYKLEGNLSCFGSSLLKITGHIITTRHGFVGP